MRTKASHTKSPFALMLLIGILVVATLVAISRFFILPNVETNLQNKILHHLQGHVNEEMFINVSGRDVSVKAVVIDENEAEDLKELVSNVDGVRELHFSYVIKKHTSE